MTTRHWMAPVLCALVVGLVLAPAVAQQSDRDRAIDRDFSDRSELLPQSIPTHINFIANASGFQEVPAVVTQGRANVRARLNATGDGIEYRLVYDLQGAITAAHIHVGQSGANGAVAVTLCSNTPTLGGGGVPLCAGPFSGEVSGTLFEQDINPQAAAQGVNSLETLLAAMLSRVAYVNVHSSLFPAGEVRGQIARLGLTGPSPGLVGSDRELDGDDW